MRHADTAQEECSTKSMKGAWMKVSVCMAVYNGAKFIRQQLESILCQSRRPDEVIMCDDGSKDDTVRIIKEFIRENSLQNTWKLFQNEQNKGYPGNFYHTMALCGGEIIFLADQDDIWHEDKIAHMCQAFEKYPEANVISCRLKLIDAEGTDIHSIMMPVRGTNRKDLHKISIENVFYKCEWPGMVMAFRQDWYQNRIGRDSVIPHDFLICTRAAEEGGFYQMDEVLACHRRHDSNVGGEEHHLGKLLRRDRKVREIEDYMNILRAFEQENILCTEEGDVALHKKIHSMQGRYDALLSGRPGRVLRNAVKHWRETRISTLLCDLYIVLIQGYVLRK